MTDESFTTETEIWSRVIDPGVGDPSPETAREWLRLRFPDEDVERVRELSRKVNIGQLTAAEERELDSYLNVSQTLQLLHTKAWLSLRRRSAG